MRYSKLFAKTSKSIIKEDLSVNARLLSKAGFIDQLMSGSYTLLPLGFRVVKKIENIIREEMNNTGAQELLMPLMHPKEIWNETGRWDKAKDVMYQFKKENKEYALSFTHEEIVLDLIRKHAFSYKDYPIKIYHFSTKFRDELRAKSGILRGREFLMKDLYSAHTSEENLNQYYWEVAKAYQRIFEKVNLKAKITEAGGGVFTDSVTHEFQILCDSGEDLIYYCEKCDFAQNKEIAKFQENDSCPKCSAKIRTGNSIEAGNIFRFGTSYSEKMNVFFTDEKGERKLPYFASYGIGLTRLMGTLVEIFNDDKGIVWPDAVAPYQCHLIDISNKKIAATEAQKKDGTQKFSDSEKFSVSVVAGETYKKLQDSGIEVLYDDRENVTAGEKFKDADLIGIPTRLVISERTGDKIEFRKRTSAETSLLSTEEVISKIKKAA